MSNWEPRIGDEVAIYVAPHQGKRTIGKIIHSFRAPDEHHLLYVIEIETSIAPIYEVRSADWTMLPVDRALSEAVLLIKSGACQLTSAQSAALLKALKIELNI